MYSSVDEVFAEPICQQFERDTGITVELMPDTEETKSTGLLNRLLAESAAAQMPLRSDARLPDGFPFQPVAQFKAMSVDYAALAEKLEELSSGFLKQWVDDNQ